MDWIRILLSRCAALIHPKELDADLDEELLAHIDLATEENRKRGMPEEEARTVALRSFGGMTQTRELIGCSGDSRSCKRWPGISVMPCGSCVNLRALLSQRS